jgi:drug/metabolite transporter (DMT)-like permease
MVMDDAGPKRHRGELFAALAAMGFGSAYVATSFALTAFQPVPAAAWRSVLAAIAVGGIVLVRRRGDRASEAGKAEGGMPAGMAAGATPDQPASTAIQPGATAIQPDAARRAVRLLVLATLAGPLFLVSMNLAVAHVGAAIAAFVAGLYAVMSAVIAPVLLPERLTLRVLAGFVLALVGTALLAELDPDATDVVGMGWGILAALSFALYLVLARRWSARYRLDGLTVAFANCALAAVVLGGFVLATDPVLLAPADPPVEAIVAMAWLAIVAAMGPVLMVASVRLIEAARSAAFLLLNPITATVLAAILLAELPSPLQLVGGFVVLLGMAVATIPGRAGLAQPVDPF